MEKESISYDENKGYPRGKNIYYECIRCNACIKSLPDVFADCECGNISLDVPMARLTILNKSHFRIFKLVKKKSSI